MSEYKKTAHDALQWEEISQLHAATLELSKTCHELKKICVVLIGVAATVLAKFTANQLDHAFFFVPTLLAVGFWAADATAYYYQRSVRERIGDALRNIASRHEVEDYNPVSTKVSPLGAIFDASMALYFALAGLFLLGWVAYGFGAFAT